MTKKFKSFKKKIKSNLASTLTVTFAGSLIVVIILVGGTTFLAGATKINNAVDGQVDGVSELVSEKISTYYKGVETSVKLVAENPDVLKTIKELNAEKTKIRGDARKLSSSEYERVQHQLDNLVASDEAIIGAYIATSKDQFLKSPAAQIASDYNATEREWYQTAQSAQGVEWSKPYSDIETGKTCITATMPIKENGKTVGVLGVDVDFTSLADELSKNVIGASGVNAIISKDGDSYEVVYSSSQELLPSSSEKAIVDEVTNPEKEIQIPGLLSILENAPTDENAPMRYENIMLNGKSYEAAVRVDENIGLYKLIGIDEDEYLASPRMLLVSTLIVGGIIGLIVVAYMLAKLRRIGKDLTTINSTMSNLRDGDLTVEVEGKILSVEHEAGQLANSLNDTANNLRGLMKNITEASELLAGSAAEVSTGAGETNSRIEEIAITMNEIVSGIGEQACAAENSSASMAQLAERLDQLKDASASMAQLTKDVQKENQQGLESVNDLQYFTEENNKYSENVTKKIDDLSKKTESIESIVATISSIAEQTNLLALNAAIEAARAGEHGAGFSVVAGEVKKLAEQSSKYSEEIREIVNAIQQDVNSAVTVMTDATKISEDQTKAVKTVVQAFQTISDSTDNMTQSISDIHGFVEVINSNKSSIVEEIDRIAVVSQKSAASSQQISASIEEQTALTQSLASTASKLTDLSERLSEDVGKFEI